jgi:phospholipase/carboxylesterase
VGREMLESVEINPDVAPKGTVIWLHGLGADGHDFEPIVPMLGVPDALSIRYVFPHAPVRPVTINAGMQMRAWYDILEMTLSRKVDVDNLLDSADALTALIGRELASGLSADRVLLAGFSQGGAVALHAGLRYEAALAGILALSTYMPTAATLESEKSEANREIPIMMAHGTMDPMVPIAAGIAARQELIRLGYAVSWHEYPMLHQVCDEEIREIGRWITRVFGDGAES